jgi:uncharacterized protein DUF1876
VDGLAKGGAVTENKNWTIEVDLEESPDTTEARVTLRIGEKEYGGWGRARRNPSDDNVARIGEELAVARALADLSHHLVEAAVGEIEAHEGRKVQVNL